MLYQLHSVVGFQHFPNSRAGKILAMRLIKPCMLPKLAVAIKLYWQNYDRFSANKNRELP
jgi:hypothetical protein